MKINTIALALTTLFPFTASATTTTVDLLSNIVDEDPVCIIPDPELYVVASGASTVASFSPSYFADVWLAEQPSGIYCMVGNSNGETIAVEDINPSLTTGGSGDYMLSFDFLTAANDGSMVALVSSLGDAALSSVTDLTLSYTSDTDNYGVLIVIYQIDDAWKWKYCNIAQNETETLTVDLDGRNLTSSMVYAILMVSGDEDSTSQTGTISFTASVIPEPTTATLSILGLGALLLRRRRGA